MAHIFNGILLSPKKKQNELFVVRWMDLEIVILSDVCQIEKEKYRMISLICRT